MNYPNFCRDSSHTRTCEPSRNALFEVDDVPEKRAHKEKLGCICSCVIVVLFDDIPSFFNQALAFMEVSRRLDSTRHYKDHMTASGPVSVKNNSYVWPIVCSRPCFTFFLEETSSRDNTRQLKYPRKAQGYIMDRNSG